MKGLNCAIVNSADAEKLTCISITGSNVSLPGVICRSLTWLGVYLGSISSDRIIAGLMPLGVGAPTPPADTSCTTGRANPARINRRSLMTGLGIAKIAPSVTRVVTDVRARAISRLTLDYSTE